MLGSLNARMSKLLPIFVIITMMLLCLMMPVTTESAMTSTNYSIYADNIGFGGVLSTSTAYSLQDTVGGSPVGFSTSSNYEIRSGYQSMELGSLSMSVGNGSLSFGTLSVLEVVSVSTIVTVSTDSRTGYTLSIGSAGSQPLSAVADGTVTAGSEEYGVAVSGAESVPVGDVAVSSSLILASASAPINNSQTTLTFKAAISTSTFAGVRSQNITLSAVANF